MLTFYQSKSSEYIWNTQTSIQYADENFAREVMQLFTIGVELLNSDGTVKLDSSGKTIKVYSNEDIMEYSRAWTGFGKCEPISHFNNAIEIQDCNKTVLIIFILSWFKIDRQGFRGNIEETEKFLNNIDPMKIQIQWRDQYPKLGLDGKYVGDQYMMCADVPSKAFLKKGAQYRLLGNNEVSQTQHPQRDNKGNVLTHVLDSSSELSTELCQDDGNSCKFPPLVNLDRSINCFGTECSMDVVHVVQVYDVYYEYVKPACINFPFFTEGETVLKRLKDGSEIYSGCVDRAHKSNTPYFFGHFTFTGQSCNIVAVVDRDGKVAFERENTNEYSSLTYFRVHWKDDAFPHVESNNCGNYLCEEVQGRCRCNVGSENVMKFTKPPTRVEVLTQLFIGAVPTDIMNYNSMITTTDGVHVYFKYQNNVYDIDTAFEVTDEFGRKRLLKNMIYVVSLRWSKTWSDGSLSKDYQFRNPPMFYNTIPEIR